MNIKSILTVPMIAKMRRFVVKTFLYIFFLVLFFFVYITYQMLSPLSHIDGGAYIEILIVLFCVIIFSLCYFLPTAWIRQRALWLTDNPNPDIWKSGKNTVYSFYDEERQLCYEYSRKRKQFRIDALMFVNPGCYEKEWEKRSRKIRMRMEQTAIPHDGEIFVCSDCMYFSTSIRLAKKHATKDNLCKIRDIMVEMKKDDFDSPYYVCRSLEGDTVYIEYEKYKISRLLLICGDQKERYDIHDETEPSDDISNILDILYGDEECLEELKPENFISQEEFEKVWETDTEK
ncbi:hypothetical protein L6472_10445 [Prevotella sp. E13-17]|uniref:hypothetical protein n=1 Tax=Prevotella sp. E13-17 TaxID=2913616 RepID=UPI001EDC3B6D|nr:hypothetical protein [Prevotella sp. E13-17]UKK50439.1 hypothetical protein L6472_10445 [Prevotella sp. E13-17]